MIEVNVEVIIMKGLGPESVSKIFPIGYDDLPEEYTDEDIKEMAAYDVNQILYNSEDYQLYGENWRIVNFYFA